MEENSKKTQLKIEMKEDIAQGTYANLAMIAHSPTEFILDFLRMMPGVPKAEVKSRIILTPEHAKRLLNALKDNIAKYEHAHGEIRESDPSGGPVMPMNFGGPAAQA